jgi:hypothetical protein
LGRFHGIDALAEMFPGITPMHFGLNDPIQFNDPMGLCQGCSTWDDVLRVLKEDPSKLQAGVYVKGKDGSFVHAEGMVIEGVTVTPNGNYRDSERNRFEHIQIITNGWGPLRTAYEIQGGENQPLTAAEYIDYVGPDNEAAARMMTFTAFMWPGAPGGGAAAPRGWNPPLARVGQVKAGAYSAPKAGGAAPKPVPSSGPLKNASGNLDDAASAARKQPYGPVNKVFRRLPKNAQDAQALSEAEAGMGRDLKLKLGDPRYQGWEKWHHSVGPKGSKSVVHYLRNPKTGYKTDFKFKDD